LQGSRRSHHENPFTLGVDTVGGVVSMPTSVADDTGLVSGVESVAVATRS